MQYKCKKCDSDLSMRINAGRWVTIKCDCQMLIIYFDGCMKVKSKEDYLKWKEDKKDKNAI